MSAVVPGAVPYKASLAKSLIGPAGEYHCLAQLLARGYLATPAPPATPEADILVLSLDGAITAMIQGKIRTHGGDHGSMMNKKHKKITRPHLCSMPSSLLEEQDTTRIRTCPCRTALTAGCRYTTN